MATKILNGLDLTSQKIINLADPTSATDATNKQYVDNFVNGLSYKDEVQAATTTNGTLASAYANGGTVDGVSLVTGMRILLKNQSSGAENGIYTVNASGAPTRSTDSDATAELTQATVRVAQGSTNINTQWTQTATVTTVGTTAQTWVNTTGGVYTAGNGISISSNVVTAVATTGIIVNGSGIGIDSSYSGLAKRYSVNVPNGSTSAVITHSLGTLDVLVQVNEITGGAVVDPDITITSTSVVTLTFATAPSAAQYRVTVLA